MCASGFAARCRLVSSRQSIVDYLIEQMADSGNVSARKLFGGNGVYCEAKVIALISDDQFFVRPTRAGRAFIGEVEEAPPYEGAKPCFLIAEERWDDPRWMGKLVRLTADELPLPKKKVTKANS